MLYYIILYFIILYYIILYYIYISIHKRIILWCSIPHHMGGDAMPCAAGHPWWAILTGPSTQWDGRTGACCGLWAMGRCSEFPGDAAGKLWENHGKCWENGGKSVSWSPKANWNSELQSEIWDGDSSGRNDHITDQQLGPMILQYFC